ncbi:hypothetical protein VB776_15750 [Arcicella sp. DC2W]|uniref:Anti-sigma factor n=1 Tax=Arcicella gelida TaxID=2984195 RepID=A0ABU5S7F8_9BACT|nr:hypothetical protein [Arcicella sp. DC2W]MEA5404387.1 hypothetical protein [Arcicella sp. DC2W]
MNITSEDTLRLINHLSGDETEEEKTAIIEELKSNPDLLREYEKLQKLRTAMKASVISKKIKAIHETAQKEESEQTD